MKYIKLTVLTIFTLYLFIGCEKDLLNTIPNDRISTEIFWQTDEDALFGSNAVYSYLEDVNRFFMWDGITDIGHRNTTQNVEAFIELGQHTSTDVPILEVWSQNYNGIRAANTFFDNIDAVEAIDVGLIDRLKGEVRFLRAFYYFRLVSLYGDVPLITTTISLEESRGLNRNAADEVWNFINAELTAAAEELPISQPEKGRITKGAALSMKARVLLFNGKYVDAAIAAKKVMDMNVYSLHSSYENLFTYEAENNSEVIFDVQYLKDTYSNNAFQRLAPFSQRSSFGSYVPTKKLVDSYQTNEGKDIFDPSSNFNIENPYANRDPRLKYTMYTIGDILPDGKVYNSAPGSGTADAVGSTFNATATGFNVKKYVNKEDLSQPDNCGINIMIMRYAEVLLTYAEAKIEANELDQSVLDAINLIRQRPDVNMPMITVLGSQSEMREVVRRERVTELAFEGLRYFDILRWKIGEDVMPGPIYGITYLENGTPKTVEVTAFIKVFDPKRHYLWPIPQTEKDLNPNLGQNPGW